MAQAKKFLHDALRDLVIFPWFLAIERIIRAVQAVQR